MSLSVREIGSGFFAEASGVDLRAPLAAQDVGAIHAAMDRHGLPAFHDQRLTDAQRIAFSRRLGPLEKSGMGNITKPRGSAHGRRHGRRREPRP